MPSIEVRRPLVAIPAYRLASGRVSGWLTGGYALPEGYVHALRRAGVTPVLLPEPVDGRAEEVLGPFDGLLLAGGGDVDPARYGAERHDRVYGVDAERDALELALVPAALERGLPTLAVCRGLQVVNVALGGTLCQHLPDEVGREAHGDPSSGLAAEHPVRVSPRSRLAAAVGAEQVERCASHHHQGLDRLGDGLAPVAWADDGLVEAVEASSDDRWLVGVQWHPEATAEADPVQQALFDAFAAEVRRTAAEVARST